MDQIEGMINVSCFIIQNSRSDSLSSAGNLSNEENNGNEDISTKLKNDLENTTNTVISTI